MLLFQLRNKDVRQKIMMHRNVKFYDSLTLFHSEPVAEFQKKDIVGSIFPSIEKVGHIV